MSHSFFAFCQQLGETPALALFALLTMGVLLVNGWTDAPTPSPGRWSPGLCPSAGRCSWRRCAILQGFAA